MSLEALTIGGGVFLLVWRNLRGELPFQAPSCYSGDSSFMQENENPVMGDPWQGWAWRSKSQIPSSLKEQDDVPCGEKNRFSGSETQRRKELVRFGRLSPVTEHYHTAPRSQLYQGKHNYFPAHHSFGWIIQ